ncbi:MAG: enoyl-CoA hydratase/isomerase family protein, partial [Dehalococcoidia bacterium]|nr:enoyl-CoA hydratase/isomerase family protein [Dehalococcoidia bacterium]
IRIRYEAVGSIFALMREIGAPVIAAVNGYAITGGFELALNCDIIIASRNASFRDTHARIRVIPGGGNTQRLPRMIGEKRAKEILFTSDFVSAEQAERWGIVNRVVPAERLVDECMEMARKLASQPGGMVAKLKKMVDEGLGMDYRSALAYEQLESVSGWAGLDSGEFRTRGRGVIDRGSGEAQAG